MADADGLAAAVPGAAVDAGSASTIAGTVDGAVAAAMGRVAELEADTHPLGSRLGDPVPAPPNPVSVNYGSALNPASSAPSAVQVPEQQGGQ